MTHTGNLTHRRIVFCDFDGTLTAEETLVAVFKIFTPKLFNEMEAKLWSREISLREGVRKLIESIPSSRYPEILDYVSTQPLRPGLEALLDYLDAQAVPFVVVSGGLRGMVETKLGKFKARIHDTYAVDVETSGPALQAFSDFEGGDELIAKVTIMEHYRFETSVAIGDGVTDFNMAKKADIVFARDHLAHHLKEAGFAFTPWETFYDIRDALAARWKKSA